MENAERYPSTGASRRRMRAHIEWKVDTHIRWATGPTISDTRCFISPAALLVNVIAARPKGETRCSATRKAMRCVRTRVLPDPAPATTRIGPSGADAASRCTGLSPASTASVVITPVSYRRPYACSGVAATSVGRDVGLELELLGGLGLLSPGAQQAGVIGVQGDGERAARVDLETEIGLPFALERHRRGIHSPRQAGEPHPLGVEEPGAVRGLDASHKNFATLAVSR